MLRKNLLTALCMLALIGGSMALGAPMAQAAQPVFPVMNTSESPPDGVWFRYGPDPNQTTMTTGLGVYMGEHVRAKCFWHGTPFGPYQNDVWYYAYDIERPTVNGASNEGWINTHYVDDGMTANNPNPAVPQCATGSGKGDGAGGGGGKGGGTGSPPPAKPCGQPSGGVGAKLLAAARCTAFQTKLEAQCGAAIAGFLFLPLKSLKAAKTAKGLVDLRKLKKDLRPIGKLYNKLSLIKYNKKAPTGFRTPKQTLATVDGVRKAKDLIRLLPNLRKAVSATDFNELALNIAEITGLKPCVEAIVTGLSR